MKPLNAPCHMQVKDQSRMPRLMQYRSVRGVNMHHRLLGTGRRPGHSFQALNQETPQSPYMTHNVHSLTHISRTYPLQPHQ